MTKADIRSLIGYHPDPAAVRKRLLREAEELLRWGQTTERHQPVLSSLKGQLRKFYLYPTFDCPLRCPYCYAEGGERHVDELDAQAFLRSFCAQHGIQKLIISSPVPMGRAAGTNVPPFEWRSDIKPAYAITPKFSCGLGHSLYMQPDGSLYPCYAWCKKEHQLGDLSQESLEDVLERADLLAVANSGVDTNERCRSCEVRYFCGGMCKIYVRNKHDLNSGGFDCADTKSNILRMLAEQGIDVGKASRRRKPMKVRQVQPFKK